DEQASAAGSAASVAQRIASNHRLTDPIDRELVDQRARVFVTIALQRVAVDDELSSPTNRHHGLTAIAGTWRGDASTGKHRIAAHVQRGVALRMEVESANGATIEAVSIDVHHDSRLRV